MPTPALHIAIIVHSLNHNNIGRVYPFVRALIGAVDTSCTLVGWDDGGELFPLLRALQMPIVRLTRPVAQTSPGELVQALAGCTLIHCFKNQQHLPLAHTAAQMLGVPLVLDLDDWELGLYLEGVARWPHWRRALSGLPITKRMAAYLELERLARVAPAALTVNSRALQAHFGGQIVYTAADAQAFEPVLAGGAAFRAAHGIARNAPVIGFLGTPHPHKGIEELLAAFAVVRQHNPAARLLFVGVPQQNAYAARLQALPGVVRVGYIAADEYPAAYAACDTIAIPQRAVTEGIMQTPAKLILAMAAARPIIATTVGDMPAILGDAGILIAPENSAALATALLGLLADSGQRAQLGERARTRFLAGFTLEHLRATMLAVYHRVSEPAASSKQQA